MFVRFPVSKWMNNIDNIVEISPDLLADLDCGRVAGPNKMLLLRFTRKCLLEYYVDYCQTTICDAGATVNHIMFVTNEFFRRHYG